MTGKNHFDVLGVQPNATPEQIRKAYLLRSKLLHPDRFDQTSQRAEWELANELLKELNNAYSALRASTSQPQQNSTAQPHPPSQPPPRRERPPSPRPSVKLGRLKPGIGWFDSLPRSTQERLAARVAGTNKLQYAINLDGVSWNYFWTFLLLGWFVILFHQASTERYLIG